MGFRAITLSVRIILPALLWAQTTWSVTAWAAESTDPFARGIDPVGFKLAVTGNRYITVEGASVAPSGSYRLTLGADYGRGLLALKRGDTKLANLIVQRLDLQMSGSFVVGESVELGFGLPVTVYQENNFARLERDSGFVDTPPASDGLNDLRLVGKLTVLSEATRFISLALVAELRLPTGEEDSFLGELGDVVAPRLVAERSLTDAWLLAMEFGYRFRPNPGQYLNLYVGDELQLGIATRYELPPILGMNSWGVYGEMLVSTPARQAFSTVGNDALKTSSTALAALRGVFATNWELSVGVGRGLGLQTGYGRSGLRGLFTLSYAQRAVSGAGDDCAALDIDKDGIVNADDACPRVFGVARYDGCPDSDDDEIPDNEDACPKKPGPPTNDGCPIDEGSALASLSENTITLRGSIQFKYDKAVMRPGSLEVVKAVAQIMISHPELRLISIEGHTDSLGGPSYNRALSQRRAEAVRTKLISMGIDADRLVARGYGEDKPMASNKSALGRARNRRVEFVILKRSDNNPSGR